MFGIGLLLVFGLGSIALFPLLFTVKSWLPSFMETGQVGDTINGIAGPFIALGAAAITFLAFYVQLNANTDQRQQFKEQAADVKIDRFENRFFEMLRIHRSNVEEQNVQNTITGRKVFTTYYFELRYIYFVLRENMAKDAPSSKVSEEELTNLAYLIFFYGIGHVTKSVFEQIAPDYCKLSFFTKSLERLVAEKDKFLKTKPGERADLEVEFSKDDKATFIQVYQPFTGHGTKIGHYYRHLFQTVRYVDGQEVTFLDQEQKKSYIKMLRAQLSNFEQIMFYYNSVSTLGQDWHSYILDYRMIANLPLAFADFGLTPEEKYRETIKEQPDFFDWEKVKSSLELGGERT